MRDMLRASFFAIGIFLLAAFVQAVPLAHADDPAVFAVSGVVHDDAGRPVAGAWVTGWTIGDAGEHHDKNETDAEGRFTLRLPAGRGEVVAGHEDHPNKAAARLLVEGDVADLRLVLPTPPARDAVVAGRVLDADGNPIEGAEVTLSQGCCYAMDGGMTKPYGGASDGGAEGGEAGAAEPAIAPSPPIRHYDDDHQTTRTGADGAYRFETYPGPRQVTAYAKGYAQATTTVEARENATITADLTLEKVPPADAVLVVRVVDATTGAPLRGADVSLHNAEWSHYAWAETGADGVARLTTMPGWAIVNVHHYGGSGAIDASAELMRTPHESYYAFAKALRLASGERTLDATLEKKAEPTIVLTGYVVDPDRKAGVAGAQVSVWNQDTGDWGGATTDATGSYKLLVRPGHYTMNAWAENHLPGVATFTIAPGETAVRVDVEAPEGEQKHAPCVDGCHEPRPMPLLAEDESSTKGGTAGAPATSGDAPTAFRTAGGDAAAESDDGERALAYRGGGGGLPPYDPEDAGTVPAGARETRTGSAEVPAIGLGVALVALGLLALARRR